MSEDQKTVTPENSYNSAAEGSGYCVYNIVT